MPPPISAVLPVKVLLDTVIGMLLLTAIAPPVNAVLSTKVLPDTVSAPSLFIAPPRLLSLPAKVESITASAP